MTVSSLADLRGAVELMMRRGMRLFEAEGWPACLFVQSETGLECLGMPAMPAGAEDRRAMIETYLEASGAFRFGLLMPAMQVTFDPDAPFGELMVLLLGDGEEEQLFVADIARGAEGREVGEFRRLHQADGWFVGLNECLSSGGGGELPG